MAASIARKIAAILFALAMVGSVAVGPALADDDGDVSVGGDGVNVGGDDGVTVGAGDDGSTNGSTTVSVDADQDGAEADAEVSGGDGSGTDGALDCSVDTSSQEADCEPSGADGGDGIPMPEGAPEAPDVGDAPEAPDMGDAPGSGGSGDDGGDSGGNAAPPTTMDEISTPEFPVDAPDLPVNYEEDVPFEAFPNFCNPPYGVEDVRENNPVEPTDPLPGAVKEQLPKSAPKKPPQTPVGNPLSLVAAPVNQCDVFNPYDPAVNPTSPPDDPSATFERRSESAGQDGVYLNWAAEGTTDEGAAPGGESMAVVLASQNMTAVIVEPSATNGRSDTGGGVDFRMPGNSPNQGTYVVNAVAFGQGASASIKCDGSECKPKAGGVPSGNAIPAFPAGGGSDGGEDPEPDPSADTGEPDVIQDGDEVLIRDDREGSLGEGLPGGENAAIIYTNGSRVVTREDAQASGNGRQANVETNYDSGRYPGDDDVYVLAKGDGAGVIVGLNCDDYRCTPAQGTGVYAGPGSMIFEMIPDPPEGVPSP